MIVEVQDFELLKNVVEYASRLNKIEKHNCKSSPVEYEELLDYFEKKMKHPDKLVLAYIENNEILGVAAIGALPKDLYLQTEGGIFAEYNYQKIAGEFFKYIEKNYKGYEFYSAYSGENVEAIKFMKSVGAECVDDHIIFVIKLADYMVKEIDNVVELPKHYYEQFTSLHDKNFPTMYWNSKRLIESEDKFEIKVKIVNNEIIGYVISSIWRDDNNEIYATYSKNNDFDVLRDLVYSVLNTPKLNNEYEYMVYTDRLDEFEQSVLEKCGFKRVGTSVCYHIDKI